MVPAAEESGLKKLTELKSTLRSLAPNLCAYAIVISKADDAEGKDNTIAEADSEEIIKKYDFDDIVFLSTTAPRHVGYSAAGVMKHLLSQLHPKYQPSHWSETMRKRKRDFKMEARMRGDTPISQETNNKPSQCNLS
jgi:adenine-specific DNA methylase